MPEFLPDTRNDLRFGFGVITEPFDPNASESILTDYLLDQGWDAARPWVRADIRAASNLTELSQQIADENFWWQRVIQTAQQLHPKLAHVMGQCWERDAVRFKTPDIAGEIPHPEDYESASVPPKYPQYFSPRGTHPGDSIPKLLVLISKEDGVTQRESVLTSVTIKSSIETLLDNNSSSDPALLALVCEQAYFCGISIEQIWDIVLSKRFLRESRYLGAYRGFIIQAARYAPRVYAGIKRRYDSADEWQKRRMVDVYEPEKTDLSDAFTR